jgi:hypothetical protein
VIGQGTRASQQVTRILLAVAVPGAWTLEERHVLPRKPLVRRLESHMPLQEYSV